MMTDGESPQNPGDGEIHSVQLVHIDPRDQGEATAHHKQLQPQDAAGRTSFDLRAVPNFLTCGSVTKKPIYELAEIIWVTDKYYESEIYYI